MSILKSYRKRPQKIMHASDMGFSQEEALSYDSDLEFGSSWSQKLEEPKKSGSNSGVLAKSLWTKLSMC